MSEKDLSPSEEACDTVDHKPQCSDKIKPEVAEILQELPESKRKVVIKSIQAIERESFRGPIPHPRLLKGYDDIQKGFAERIVAMAEKEQQHRFDCERKVIKSSISSTKRGQWMGFIIAIFFCIAAIAMCFLGHPIVAGIIGGSTLVAVVTVFITNRPSKSEEED